MTNPYYNPSGSPPLPVGQTPVDPNLTAIAAGFQLLYTSPQFDGPLVIEGTNVLSIGSPASAVSGISVSPATGLGAAVIRSYGPAGSVGLNVNLQNAASGPKALFAVLNPVELIDDPFVWSGAYQPAFNELVSLTGTATGGGAAINQYNIVETVDGSALSTAMTGLNVLHYYGGGTTKGGRVGFQYSLYQGGGANTDSGVSNFYVAGAVYCSATYTQPGATVTAPLGNIVAWNTSADITSSAVQNLLSINSYEADLVTPAGSTYAIRAIVAITTGGLGPQGFWADAMLWFHGGPLSITANNLRYGILFADVQPWPIEPTAGTVLGANSGGASQTTTSLQAKWGVDLSQVVFPATGNPYDGGVLRSNGITIDGLGTIHQGSAYLSSSTSGYAVDCKGSVVSAAAIDAAGTGYTASAYEAVTTAYGGQFYIMSDSSGVPTSVTMQVAPSYPSLSVPGGATTAVATINLRPNSLGSGLTLNLTWNTAATTLALQPSGGPTAIGGLLGLARYTVAAGAAQLPAASSGLVGRMAQVTDFSGAPTYRGAIGSGGGAVVVNVLCINATTWVTV